MSPPRKRNTKRPQPSFANIPLDKGRARKPSTKRLLPSPAASSPGFPDYLVTIEKNIGDIYSFVEPIGSGKNGLACKIQARSSGHLYCLKTISPTVTDPDERDRIRATLVKEVEILRPLSHRCLPRIYEYNVEARLPYYVCTFHPGSTLSVVRQARRRLRIDEAVFVIVSLIDVLEYLHSEGRTHCDLHQNNILLSDRIFAEGLMVIDFGAGHRDSDSASNTPDRGTVQFKDVPGQARHRTLVHRHLFEEAFRANDFRAFGQALAFMEQCFFAYASHDQRLLYREFCRLLQETTFRSWQDVRTHFEHVIDPDLFMTRTERLFVMKDGSRRAITLPAIEPVPVGEAVLAIVNTACFQRLRTIKQLSFCEWYFPGATHSRFEHSLGTFGTAYKAMAMLSRDSNFKSRFHQVNINGTLLAALVHDIGHYPFAHVIEHYVSARYSEDKAVRDAVHHFNHTLTLIEEDQELRTAIDTFWGEDTRAEARRVLSRQLPPLSDLLDGPVDCDKLDYLRRDAHHAGVAYGDGLDITGVLSSFRCSPTSGSLLVDAGSVHAIEGFMIVQDQMLTAVYWHETIRAVFAMFHRFLDGCLAKKTDRLIELVTQLKRCSSEHEAFNRVIIPLLNGKPKRRTAARSGPSQEELEPLIRLHSAPRFTEIYPPIARYSRLDVENPKHPASPFSNIFTSIVSSPSSIASSVPILWDSVKRLRMCFQEALRDRRVEPGRFGVLVDVPWGKGSNRVVSVVDPDGGKERPITEVSHLSPTIFLDPTAFSAPIRVYIAPTIFEKVDHSLESVKAAAEERYFSKDKSFGDHVEEDTI